MSNLQKFRSEFPHTDREMVYLDHAAVSPMNNRVKANLLAYIRQAQGEKIENWFDTMDMAVAAREKFGRLINAPKERVAAVRNTTDGMILLARGLDWQKGDRIILHRMEFPSNVYPWWDLQPFGVALDFLDTPQGAVAPADLEKVVTDRTRLVAVSWVQYFSGYKNDIAALADWCHSRRILLAVDVMQGLGALKYDNASAQADFIATGSAKWLMGPQGVGFIYITEELQERIHPPHLGWQSRSDLLNFHAYDQPLKADASRYEFATPFSLGVWGVNGAFDLLLEAGQPAIENRIIELTDYLVHQLLTRNYRIVSDRCDGVKSGILITSNHNPERNQQIFEYLHKKDIHISLRNGNLRVSPHFYNTEAELDKLVEVVGHL
ncbi:MAG: aminotransferase class V-fold PLP-dependent enzyme [Candidatus Neomarinimicrobiota bacterium]